MEETEVETGFTDSIWEAPEIKNSKDPRIPAVLNDYVAPPFENGQDSEEVNVEGAEHGEAIIYFDKDSEVVATEVIKEPTE